VAVRALAAWAGLFGLLNLELFGHFNNVIENRSVLFDLSVAALGATIGSTGYRLSVAGALTGEARFRVFSHESASSL
jgi:hypothetical protein